MSSYDQDEDHGCNDASPGIWAIGKDFTRRNKGVESILLLYDQDNPSISFGYMSVGILTQLMRQSILIILVHMVLNLVTIILKFWAL